MPNSPLPSFRNPPVTEVVLGVQFQPLPLRSFHIGILAREFPELTEISEQPFIAPVFELFGGPPSFPHIGFEFGTGAPPARYWFRSPDARALVQVQTDRLLVNWTKPAEEDVYPRYPEIRARFIDALGKLENFVKPLGVDQIRPNQCEVTYISTIHLPEGSPHSELWRIFKFWSKDYQDDQGRVIEDATVNFRYVLTGSKDEPIGRLHAQVQPILRVVDQRPGVQLTLTARGKPSSDTSLASLEFLDLGREAVVRAFASMTRDGMHALWERESG